MLIEDETHLKGWIARDVEPFSDAEPEALAKYVLALIKKQLEDAELEKLCLDRLQDFLGADTKAFVERLFACVKTNAYLPSSKAGVTPTVAATPPGSATPTTGSSRHQSATAPKSSPPGVPMQRGGEELLSLDNDLLEGADEDAEESASSRSPSSRGSDSGSEAKKADVGRAGAPISTPTASKPAGEAKKDESSQRRNETAKTTTVATRRRLAASPPQSATADTKRQRSSHQPHQRITNISPIRNSSANELTSAGMRRGVSSGAGTRHSRRRSWSRERTGREGSRSPKSRSRSRSPIYRKRGPLDEHRRHRCRDFHEKGYCTRGDKCPFDHGPDPVVVEKVSAALEKIIGGTGGSGSNPPPPGMERSYGVSGGMDGSGGYNPEAPALNAGSAVTQKLGNFSVPPPPIPAGFIRAGAATIIRHVMPTQIAAGMTSTHFPPPTVIGGGSAGAMQMPNFSTPPPSLGAAMPTMGQSMGSAQMMVPTQVQQRFMRPSLRGMVGGLGDHRFRPYGMMGPRPSLAATNPALCSLIVKKIPEEMNRIPTLDKHFSKFGQITNLHVQYEGRPDWALVTYKTRREAMNAYKSTEPILNNRFVRVFWQTGPGEQPVEAPVPIVDTGDGSTPIPSQAEVCKEAIKAPINLNRTFKKSYNPHQEGGGPQPVQSVDTELQEASEGVQQPTEEDTLEAPSVPIRSAPSAPAFNYRAVAAKRKAASESLLRMREVHRRKTEIYAKLNEQMKDLLGKVKSATTKEAKVKLMELVKKLDASTKAVKVEVEEMTTKITELKLKADEEALKSKAFVPPTMAPGGIGLQEKMPSSLSCDSGTNGNDSTGPAIPPTPKRLSAEADRTKLFRVVHVSGCAPEMHDELIKHMESYGDLFDFDIGAGRGPAPAVFTYKEQIDAQRAVNEAASTFATTPGAVPIKVHWAPASLGQGAGVVPDRERKPHMQMTPRDLLAQLAGSDDDDSDGDEEHKQRAAVADAEENDEEEEL